MKNCDITYKEMATLIHKQNKMEKRNNYYRSTPFNKCSIKFRKKQQQKHIVPISFRGLVCDISKSESIDFIKPNEHTRSISIRGEDGILYNFITSYTKHINKFQESMDNHKDIILEAYINKKKSNKNVKHLCSAGHSSNVNIGILHAEDSIIESQSN